MATTIAELTQTNPDDRLVRQINCVVKAVPGDVIRVKDLELKTKVRAVLMSPRGVTYQIYYFHNGEQKSVYLYDDEFELVS